MATFAGRYSEPFIDQYGNSRPGLSVTVYLRGTTTKATLYTSRTKATTLANPITTDANGNGSFFADPGDLYDILTGGVTLPIAIPADAAEFATYQPLAVDASNLALGRSTRASLAKALGGTGIAKVAIVADSLAVGATTSPATTRRITSWPVRLRALLTAEGLPLGGDGMVVAGGFPYDTRWTFAGGFARFSSGTSDFLASSSAAGATATYVSDTAGTSVIIWYLQGAFGAFTYTIDGGAATTVTPTGGATTIGSVTVSSLANTVHTVVITSTTATLTGIAGAETRSASGVVISNFGAGGTTTTNWIDQSQGFLLLPTVLIWAPTTTFIMLGTNDSTNGVSTATYIANITSLITSLQAVGSDIVLCTPLANFSVPQGPTLDAYAVALIALAATRTVPLFDSRLRLGTFTQANGFGLYEADQVHLSPAGFAEIARGALKQLAA